MLRVSDGASSSSRHWDGRLHPLGCQASIGFAIGRRPPDSIPNKLRSHLRSEPDEVNVASGVVAMGRSAWRAVSAAAEGRMPTLGCAQPSSLACFCPEICFSGQIQCLFPTLLDS